MENFYRNGLFFDLLDARIFNELMADPSRLSRQIPAGFADWTISELIACHVATETRQSANEDVVLQ